MRARLFFFQEKDAKYRLPLQRRGKCKKEIIRFEIDLLSSRIPSIPLKGVWMERFIDRESRVSLRLFQNFRKISLDSFSPRTNATKLAFEEGKFMKRKRKTCKDR